MARNRIRLDETDNEILSLLARDASLKNKELAKRIGLAPSTCLSRVRRLEQQGVIVGYRAIVARSGLGARVEGWADVRFAQATPELTRRFVRLIEEAPEIIEAHRVAGQADYLIRFCAGDLSAWNAFRESLEVLGCRAETRLSVLVEAVK